MSAAPRWIGVSFMPILIGELLADRKLVTRRLMSAAHADYAQFVWEDGVDNVTHYLQRRSPFGAAGDRLWVRESLERRNGLVAYSGDPSLFARLDGELVPWPWKRSRLPGRYCPRRFSRTTLEVVDVRAERLQDITEEDARLEGIPRNWAGDDDTFVGEEDGWFTPQGYDHWKKYPELDCLDDGTIGGGVRAYVFEAREAFLLWWDRLHPEVPARLNPWVWRVAFRRGAAEAVGTGGAS